MKRILIACECSGTVRDAFTRRGWDAWSCDLQPSQTPGQHIQGDAIEAIRHGMDGKPWDFVIAHPPCTYLASMGIWWNAKRPERWASTYAAKSFVEQIWAMPVRYMALENPIGYLNKNWMKPTQIINPWQFGHEAHKPTCLWLRNISPLQPTKIVGRGEFYVKANGSRVSAWSHKQSGTNKSKRAGIAAKTFPGIAEAMAEQWSRPELKTMTLFEPLGISL